MEIINRVARSGILTFDLEAFWDGGRIVEFDIEPFLFGGLVLREKEYRAHVAGHRWESYDDSHVAVFCSTEAIIPTWAWMLIGSKLRGRARSVSYGRQADLLRDWYTQALATHDWTKYSDRIVVIKGCGALAVPPSAYLAATLALQGVARKMMYGEACSSVPVWRRPK